MQWATAVKGLSCGDTKGCPRLVCTVATLARCTWGGCLRPGTWWARAVNWNEGLHSVWLGKLNRLMRRTKGYTRGVEMLAYSLALVCWRQEEKPNTCLC